MIAHHSHQLSRAETVDVSPMVLIKSVQLVINQQWPSDVLIEDERHLIRCRVGKLVSKSSVHIAIVSVAEKLLTVHFRPWFATSIWH